MRPQPIALQARPKALTRLQNLVSDGKPREWFKVTNADGNSGDEARIDIFDMIDSWGGAPGEESFWGGISAEGFQRVLSSITTPRLALHVNSPGGDVWDGVAILNALIQHPAHITAYVDGYAASIASVIVMGADEVEMGLGSNMMIHDASTIAIGDAAEMQATADLLDKVSDNIASVYAFRTGQPAAQWRDLMRAETWFNADEAVTAGLAQRVAAPPTDGQTQDAGRRWVTASWRYSSREQAPAPSFISSQSCTDAADCATTAPPRPDPAAEAEAPVQLPEPVFDGPQLLRALREAVKA